MATKNRALALTDVATFKLVEREVPTTPPNGVIVKVAYAGVCHGDVHFSQWSFHPDYTFPIVLGHETSGTIFKIGENAANANLRVGENVLVYPWGNCMKCAVCKHGEPYCENVNLPTGSGPRGTNMYGVWCDGGFQEYVAVYDTNCIIKVKEGIPMDQAALIPCSGISTFSACSKMKAPVEKALKIQGKALVGVVGAGGLGLWAIQFLKAFFPPEVKVVAIDVVKEKLDDAKQQGADQTFQWGIKESDDEVVKNFTKEVGGYLDGVVDFTGLAAVHTRIYHILNVGGAMVLVGLGEKMADLPLTPMLFKGISILANIVGTREDCRQVMDLVLAGKVKPPPTTLVKLDQVEENIIKMKENKQRGRAVVKM